MEFLSNISQLRNLWLRSPDERLTSWREFRIDLQDYYVHQAANKSEEDDARLRSALTAISTWWEQMPTVNVAMDPYNSESWPTIWELVHEGECCKYSRGLAMAYNMHYLDDSVVITLDRVRDHSFNDEYMIATFDGKYALNSLHGRVVDLQSVDSLEVRESWRVQDQLLEKQ